MTKHLKNNSMEEKDTATIEEMEAKLAAKLGMQIIQDNGEELHK